MHVYKRAGFKIRHYNKFAYPNTNLRETKLDRHLAGFMGSTVLGNYNNHDHSSERLDNIYMVNPLY